MLKKWEKYTDNSKKNQINKLNNQTQKKGNKKTMFTKIIIGLIVVKLCNANVNAKSDILIYSTHRFFYGYLVST